MRRSTLGAIGATLLLTVQISGMGPLKTPRLEEEQ